MATPQAHAPLLEVEDSPLSQQWLGALTSARVDRALNLVGRATLRFVDAGYALSSSGTFEIGTKVSIGHRSGTLLTGTVTAVALEQSAHRVPELVVTVSDAAAKLAGSAKSRTFLQQSTADVIGALVAGTGLTPSYSGARPVHQYLLQAGTDLAYLDALTARAGLAWWVEADGRTLKVVSATTQGPTVALELGKDLEEFSVRATAAGPDKVTVTGWGEVQQERLNGIADTAARAESTFVAKASGRGKGEGTALLTSPPPRDAQEATALAEAHLAEAASGAVVATGACAANAGLGPGVAVRVTHAGPASGTYRVSRVEHLYGPAGFRSRFTAGPHREAGLTDLLAGPRTDPGFTAHGVLPALVSDLKDPENLGRAQVEFTTVSGTVASAWARVLSLGGGDKRGLVFHPEVQDEVLIAFEQSDVRRPVIIGGLFSKKKGLPGTGYVKDNQVEVRRITSRLGHVVELADGGGEDSQHVLIKLGTAEHRIRLGKDRLDLEVKDKPVKVTDGQAVVELSGTGDVTITGNKVTIKAKSGISLDGGPEVSVKSNAAVKVEGATVAVKGSAQASVEGGSMLTLKGGMVAIN